MGYIEQQQSHAYKNINSLRYRENYVLKHCVIDIFLDVP